MTAHPPITMDTDLYSLYILSWFLFTYTDQHNELNESLTFLNVDIPPKINKFGGA